MTSLLAVRRTAFLDPPCDITLAPDSAGGEFADGLREARSARELVGSLLADAQEDAYLGDAYKFHPEGFYPLTTSSVKGYSALDNVKREAA